MAKWWKKVYNMIYEKKREKLIAKNYWMFACYIHLEGPGHSAVLKH